MGTGGNVAGDVKLTTHFHLVQRSRMLEAIPPSSLYAFMAWCSVEAQGQLYLYFSRQVSIPTELLQLTANKQRNRIFPACFGFY
jgi:hypothetical protein